jgi:hypothetical protein
MSKLDEVKETLNTLRVAMSLSFGFIVFISGALIKRYDKGSTDNVFWFGIILIVLFLITIILLIYKISQKKEIRGL